MVQNCDVSSVPASPLIEARAIHYFEGWNELDTDVSWNGGDYGMRVLQLLGSRRQFGQ